MIPKIIHYCWFGGKKKPKLVRECIASWEIYLSGYQLIEWNETNSDLNHPFVKEMYNQKKWAFVADYIRLEKIYEYGGIYLDTDMMVLKNFDKFLENDCFFGAEDSNFINMGVIGAHHKNNFIKECKEVYDSLIIGKDINFGEITIPRLVTKKFRAMYHFEYNFDKVIAFDGIKVYPFSFFYPLPFDEKNKINDYKSYISKETVAVHLWSSSWIEYSEFYYLRNRNYSKGFSIVFVNIIGNKILDFQYLRKVLSCIKESIKNNNV